MLIIGLNTKGSQALKMICSVVLLNPMPMLCTNCRWDRAQGESDGDIGLESQ